MQTLIVPNGGKDGAILVTSQGATSVLVANPALLHILKATSHLTAAADAAASTATQNSFAKMAVGASHLAVELVEAAFGPLDKDRAIVYQDDGDGFTCGSTGKPPIPIHWPANPVKEPGDLLKSRAIAPDVIELVRLAKAQGKNLLLLLDDPAALAKQVGVKLSEKSLADLGRLSPEKVAGVTDPVDKEVVQLFRAVLKDGRYTSSWIERPYEIARALDVKISEAALQRVAGVGGQIGGAGIRSDSAICAGVIWAGVCIAVGTLFVGQINPLDTLIDDRSGKAKF